MTRRILLALALAAVLLAGSPAHLHQPAAAAAAGCPPSRPTWLGGTFRGSDGRAINAHIGVGLKDSGGVDVLADGSRDPDGAYSFIQKFNPTVPATGATDPRQAATAVRTWGACVAANVAWSFIEIYPKRPTPSDPGNERTDYSRYGLGSYYFLRVTAGQRYDVLLRTPLIYQQGGNTGGMQGYITRGGRPVPVASISPVRAFTRQPGAACGIEGMAAIANRLVTGGSGRTYFLVDFLAAGQCGTAYQAYSLRVTCRPPACGPTVITAVRKVLVVRGRWPRVDVAF